MGGPKRVSGGPGAFKVGPRRNHGGSGRKKLRKEKEEKNRRESVNGHRYPDAYIKERERKREIEREKEE
jgi:hypothetical protein